jgi:hypothetical protein
MKHINEKLRIVAILTTMLIVPCIINAQDEKTVTLVTNGTGATMEQATQNALRSAIEQAFGTFISSNTEILNDELVKDEIVSVANGNIQSYEVISETEIPDIGYATTIEATVSVSKLTSFVESKGVTAEFKGSLLAINVKQQMLNEQNETISINNIANVCKEILDKSCDFEIVRGQPKQFGDDNNQWAIPITVNVIFNKNVELFKEYFYSSIRGLSMSPNEVIQYEELGKEIYKIGLSKDGKRLGYWKTINNIDTIKQMASSNANLSYRIIKQRKSKDGSEYAELLNTSDYESIRRELENENVIFKSYDADSLQNEFDNLKKEKDVLRGKFLLKVQSFDKTKQIYHFRSHKSVLSIITIINYTRNPMLNFEIYNGINIFNPAKFFEVGSNLNRKEVRSVDFKVINRFSFTAILLTDSDRSRPSELFFRQSGGRAGYTSPYSFYLPELETDADYLDAAISLTHYEHSGKSVVSFSFNDIISLDDLGKIEEYIISPIINN